MNKLTSEAAETNAAVDGQGTLCMNLSVYYERYPFFSNNV